VGKTGVTSGGSSADTRTRGGTVRRYKSTLFRVRNSSGLTDGVFVSDLRFLRRKRHVVEVEWVSSHRSSHTSSKRVRRSTSVVGRVNGVSVVKPLRSTEVSGGVNVYIGVRLDYPDKFFTRVVEVKFDFVAGGVNRFITGELKLFDKVFVGNLSESSSFISVKVDVVYIQGSSSELRNFVGEFTSSPVALSSISELDVDFDFVVLKSNKR
jgi:hypothetical protein